MSLSSPAEPSVEVPVPEEHIPRPPNAWIIFRKVRSQEYCQAHPDQTFTQDKMSKIMSKKWAEVSKEERRHFERLAQEKLSELLALHPNYKYQPRQRGSGGKQTKPRKVKEGHVEKPRRTKKGATVLTSATDLAPAPTQATNVYSYDGEWPEANDTASNNVVGLDTAVAPSDQYPVAWDNGVSLGSVVAPNDQYLLASENVIGLDFAAAHNDQQAITNSNYTFCDTTTFSADTFEVFNPGTQPMAYYGQPYAGPSHTAMQPFVASQMNAYQPTAELGGQMQEGYTVAYDGSLQLFNADEANTLYEQTTEVDIAAESSGAYATAYSQNESSSGYFEYSTPYFTYANAIGDEHVFPHATADANGVQYSGAVLNNFSDLLAVEQELQNTWAAVVPLMA